VDSVRSDRDESRCGKLSLVKRQRHGDSRENYVMQVPRLEVGGPGDASTHLATSRPTNARSPRVRLVTC
jgi:hypothetical protein